ncbi:MAG: cation diffusion facilitator family transporter [Pseudomonadota bacterium]|nr:cation diffusion facilitator family transporter [Pseudomonadota bacterium]
MLYVAIACDLIIAVAKFGVAALTGSSALMTEGVHSLVDTGNELLLLVGVRRGHRAVDERHPFGYGKTSYVWSLIVALSVFSIGGGVSVYEGIVSLIRTPVLADPTWNYIVLGVAALFQGWSWHVSHQELERHRQAGESLWRASQRDMDVLVYTVFVINSAALVGIAIAALGVGLSHALQNPSLDPAASVMIGLVMIAAAALLARKSVSLLVGASLDHGQLEQLRAILAADPAVESVGHLLTMRLGPDSVLLTAKLRFARQLDLDQVEQAIERLERAIKVPYPSILHLYLESGALKETARRSREKPVVRAANSK